MSGFKTYRFDYNQGEAFVNVPMCLDEDQAWRRFTILVHTAANMGVVLNPTYVAWDIREVKS